MRLPTFVLAAPLAFAALSAGAAPALAQSRWKEIGKTSSGNPVFVDARSVKKAGGIIRATLRVRFVQPVDMQGKKVTSSRILAMFDCARMTLAAKENVYYVDERAGRVAQRTVNAKPGFSPMLKGSAGELALQHICAR